MLSTRKYSFFLIDHQPLSIDCFKEFFQDWPHAVYYCATDGEARSIMAGVAPDFVILRLGASEHSDSDFLAYLRQKYRNAIRIVFSDDANKSIMMKMVFSGLAHRFLSMPWDKNRNSQVLTRDLLTRSRLRKTRCWKFLESNGSLPSLPPVVQEIETSLADPDTNVDRIVSIIEKDPAIASKLLRVANSAAFSHNGRINSLHHAVTFLGFTNIRELVLYVSATEAFLLTKQCINFVERLARHSFLCARLAARVSEILSPKMEREAATAALLHDLGKLVFYSSHCGVYCDMSTDAFMNCTSTEVENEYFGINHAELGGSLMLWWNLPFDIVEAATNHNLPILDLWGVPLSVAVADRCLVEAESMGEVNSDLDHIRDEYPVDQWREEARKLVQAREPNV